MKIAKTTFLALATISLIACGGTEEKKEKFKYQHKKESKKTTTETTKSEIPIDMDNQGIGPIKDFAFDGGIDKEMAAKGEKLFKTKCMACHMPDRRLIGPAMKGIYERRNPSWVMNIMLNPEEMLKKDPIAAALLKEYGSLMINQQLKEEEARALAEYFRGI